MNLPSYKTLRALTYLTGMALFLPFAPTAWAAYNSGSTGADGAFNPTVNTEVVLPPNGVLNYTSVNIPVNVTVTFKKNASNTPVYMLVSGDATIAGTIDIRGQNAADATSLLYANTPGEGGPGGYSGGRGGRNSAGGAGLGPGGGVAGVAQLFSPYGGAGSGGGYSVVGGIARGNPEIVGGVAYGAATLQPLLGGSGGGGGYSPNINISALGLGGGGGGGALLIAASGTLSLPSTGKILATGGAGGEDPVGGSVGGSGGSGSGGAIRLVATTVSGSGTLDVLGGSKGPSVSRGGSGRIRIEGETITLTPVIFGGTAQVALSTSTTPAPVFVAGLPTLAITSVGGVNAPANPTGSGDVVVPGTVPNPVAVTFASSNIPLGNNVKLTVVPAIGAATTVTSTALTGSTASATASAQVTLPDGPSVLQATVSYALTVAMGQALSQFAQGELVESITVAATAGQANTYKLVTVSGKEFEVPQARLAGLL